MKTIVTVIMLSIILIFANMHISDSTLGKLVVTVKPEKNPISKNEFPIIVGTITDQATKPIVDATVKIALATETIVTKTDSGGNFRYEYTNSPAPGHYLINVIATKGGYGMGLGTTNYYVNGPIIPTQSLGINSDNKTNAKTVTGDNIKNNPIALKILQHIDEKKRELEIKEQKQKEITQRRAYVEEQRRIATESLLKDLESWDQQLGPFSPRNAFELFVSQVNATVQNIYWDQFNFTEQKDFEGKTAKMEILKNGGTMAEARKAFHEKASSTRSEVIKVNNDLNVKYGFADKKIQDQFNKAGKLPRFR